MRFLYANTVRPLILKLRIPQQKMLNVPTNLQPQVKSPNWKNGNNTLAKTWLYSEGIETIMKPGPLWTEIRNIE